MDKDVILRQELSELDTQDIQQLMDESGAFGDTTIDDIINSAADGSSIFEADNIIGSLKDLLIYEIKDTLMLGVEITAICIILGLLKSISGSFGEKSVSKVALLVCSSAIAAITMVNLGIVYDLASGAMDTMVHTMEILLPVMIPLLIASGGMTSAGMLSPLVSGIVTSFAAIISNIIFPVMFLSSVMFVIDSLLEKKYISSIGKFLRNAAAFATGLLVTIFGGITVIQSIVTKAADGAAFEGAKYAAGSFIPIIGRFASDSLDLAITCVRVIKSTVGVVGIIILILALLTPVIKLTAIAVIYKLTAIISQLLGENRISDSLNDTGTSIILTGVIIALTCFMFLIFIAVIISIGGNQV